MTSTKMEAKRQIQQLINSNSESLTISDESETIGSSDFDVNSRLVSMIRKVLKVRIDQPFKNSVELERLLEINSIFYRICNINTKSDFEQVPHLRFEPKTKKIYLAYAKGRKYQIYDPINNKTEKYDAQHSEFSDQVYEIYPLLPRGCTSRYDLFKFIWPAFVNDYLVSAILSFFLTLLALTYPYLTSEILGNVVPSGNIALIINSFVLGMLIASFTGFFNWWKQYFVFRSNKVLSLRLKVSIYNWFLTLPVNYLSSFTNGDLNNRITELESVATSLSTGLITGTSNLFMIIGYTILMFYFDSNLALWVIAFILLSTIPIIVLGFRIARFEKRVQSSSGELSNLSLEALGSLVQIRAAGAEPFILQKWITALRVLTSDEFKSQRVNDYVSAVSTAISSVGQIVIYLVILWRFWNAESLTEALITTTVFIVFVGSYGGFESSFKDLLYEIISQFTSVSVRWNRVKPLLEIGEKEFVEVQNTSFISKPDVQGGLSFRQVSFSYPGQSIPLFQSLNFTIKPGKINSIFGPSGCGKSTIFKLILRLDKPERGSIFMDDKPISDLYLKDYRRLFGVILQKSTLPGGSLRDAITGGLNCSDDEIWKALKAANVHNEVNDMPMKLHTVLSEGGMNISGGQRQRISIARALLRQPTILLEDEATSALDNESQRIISENLATLGITRVVIAHRLSAVAESEHMIVLNNGVVEAEGPFRKIIEQSNYLQSVMSKVSK
jgi:ABC-type bacteriocin/lantibiotic exporter with double-glycine peptidase domain